MFPAIGLTKSTFFKSLPDESLREFIDTRVLNVLDALFGGQIKGDDLCNVATNYVDLHNLLGNGKTREAILNLIPEEKQQELENRVGRDINPVNANTWSSKDINRLRGFFGFEEEKLIPEHATAKAYVEPSFGLFNHQQQAVNELLPMLFEDSRKAVLHLPTGVGKTRTAMHVVSRFLLKNNPSIVVWLASSKELLEQATETFREAWSHLGDRRVELGLLQGNRSLDLDNFSDGFLVVGLSKAWSMKRTTNHNWAIDISSKTRLVVFDEAHQSIASTYRQITNDLTLDYECALLGLTATPGRTWNEIDEDGQLAEFYDMNKVNLCVPAKNPIRYLIDNGFLSEPSFHTLFAKPGMEITKKDHIRISASLDIPEDILAGLSLSEQYVAAVLEATESLVTKGHKRILIFAANVQFTHMLSAVLNAREIHAHSITNLSTIQERSDVVRRFKSDNEDSMVLLNYGVLTTGFDAPKASAVVIARPTKSLVLYSQMIGRAIRGPKAGGTAKCEIITVLDTRLPGFGDVTEAFLNWENFWA